MDSRHTVKGKKKLVLSARRMKRRLPPEFHANRRRRIEEQTLSLEAPSSSQADSVSADAISVSTENFQPRYDEYPDLIVEPDGRPPKDDFNIISGRFIVDGKHLVQELRSLDYHRYECEKSDNGYMTLVSSTSKSSEWTMKFVVWTAPRTSCHKCVSRNGRNSSSALRFVC
ncbi:uncharacterized protein LOC120352398 isoform X2 [Nilaparvata lugens]|uniref:uncharacterized protein LOC120352398 isoform X2 n=1 Tax=Nilaparvata lugens TaxID=108931 RepID=UPI00193D952A|nr:uncharacterized protein LOC120352398 isoform X2 [Nilaparvata lugens]